MILVREVFSIDPDQMKQAKELMREYRGMATKFQHPMPKIMTDLVADHYTLVMETEFKDMGDFQESLENAFKAPEWQAFYPSFRKLMRGGRREIYSLLD